MRKALTIIADIFILLSLLVICGDLGSWVVPSIIAKIVAGIILALFTVYNVISRKKMKRKHR